MRYLLIIFVLTLTSVSSFQTVRPRNIIKIKQCCLIEVSPVPNRKISLKCLPRIAEGPETEFLQLDDSNSNNAGLVNNLELGALLTVYFVQGALGLSRLALSYFMKDELHLAPAEVAVLTGLATIPWLVKPIYGFLSDGLPLFGYRRRSYLIASGVVGFLSWLALGTIASTSVEVLIANIMASLSVAFSDVVVDSVVVEKSRVTKSTTTSLTATITDDMVSAIEVAPTEVEIASSSFVNTENNDISSSISQEDDDNISEIVQIKNNQRQWSSGDLQSLCWGAAAVGGILSAYFSGSLLEHVSPRFVFLLTSFFPLLVSITSYFIIEDPVQSIGNNIESFKETVQSKVATLKDTLSNPKIYLPILFIAGWRATPAPDSALFFFVSNDLGFKPEFLGLVSLVSSIASLAGVLAYRTWLKLVPIKDIIFWTTLISIPLGLTQVILTTHYNRIIGIPDQAFALTDSVVLTVLGQISFMPTLVLAASLCPPGVEGTLFATLMSIYNGANTLGTFLGAGLTSLLGITEDNFTNLPLLVTICSFSSFIPLAFIGLLDDFNNKPPTSTSIPSSSSIGGVLQDKPCYHDEDRFGTASTTTSGGRNTASTPSTSGGSMIVTPSSKFASLHENIVDIGIDSSKLL